MRSAALSCAALCALLSGCNTVQTLSLQNMKAYELSLATSAGGRAAAAWHGGASGPDAIFLQTLGSDGRPVGAPHQITDGQRYAYEPELQFIAGDAVLAWYEKDSVTNEMTAWLSRVDARGQEIWKRRLDADHGSARNPVVRVVEGAIWAAWIETQAAGTPAVWAIRLTPDGAPEKGPRRVGEASVNTWNLNAAVDGAGKLYVTYDARLGTQANELRLVAIDQQVALNVALSEDDGFDSVYPDFGVSANDEAALTWFDTRDDNEEIYFAVLPLADVLAGKPLAGQRLTHTHASSTGAYLAWNRDRVAVVWCDAEPGQLELYAQSFSAKGRALGDVQRLTTTPAHSSIPSIRPWKTGFLIAWNEYIAAGEGVHRPITSSRAMLRTLPP